MPTVTVSPGGTATTTLTVRNDGDIVEAYTLEVVGDCAAWSTVEPARVSLYPGTSETVALTFAPPRSHEVRAGETPLAVRVLPAEHPESVVVPEGTVTVEPFHELRTELEPRRRRGWLGARFRTAVQNKGNTPVDVALTGKQDGEELRLGFTPAQKRLEPGESAEMKLKVRAAKLIWFGEPATWPFEVQAAEADAPVEAAEPATVGATGAAGAAGSVGAKEPTRPEPVWQEPGSPDLLRPEPVPGEFLQLPVLPKWLLIVLAALLALLLAWFALVRPAVKSTAKQAATEAAQEEAARGEQQQGSATPGGPDNPAGGQGQGTGPDGQGTPGGNGGSGTGPGTGTGPGGTGTGGTQQSSATIDVESQAGGPEVAETYQVPQGKVFGITDLVVANFQGDEGVLTISFGERKITTIALETFRNQDYHWVTPIQIPENSTVTAAVTCTKPGTPATGTQASGCHQVVNVSGVLSDLAR
ncbi:MULTISPECIES: COG1470 family protein [Streptomyces]|uniref:COG1470 family protein n=1 Tax=Streptomyces TaxID=1883 RepID=UPI000DC64E24|nr:MULTISPECIES: hydrolytic protein [Streptomyces]ATY98286.1 hydrolytic protein [Streptomyces cavourensis]MBH0241634.1 hydrolytic protein [Streptomyces cavourensis]